MYNLGLRAFFETYKILQRLGIKPKDIIGMGGDIVKMGKSLFNTRVNPTLIKFIEKNGKIPAKALENIKLHARTLKSASESQKNLFLENIKSIQKAKTPKIPVKSSSPVTGVRQPGSSNLSIAERMSKIKGLNKQLDKARTEYKNIYKPRVREEAAEAFKGWTPKVIKGGKDKLATGGRVKFESGSGLELSPILSVSQTSETPNGLEVDFDDRTYGAAGIYEGDKWYAGGEYLTGNVKVDVQEEGNTIYKDTMSKDDMMQLYVGLGKREGDHVEVGTDGEGHYTLNIIKKFAKGGIANHFRKR